MMLKIPGVLTADQVKQCRQMLEQADWVDGRATAGHVAAKAKHNSQLPLDHPVAKSLGDFILEVLGLNSAFIAAALPLRVLPPRFNRYQGGGNYGTHIDNAIFSMPGSPERVRSDISITLFLNDPGEYDGGELTVQDSYGTHGVKLPAGDMVMYPGSSQHHVTPVTRGTRYAAFFWTQSLVRQDHRRMLLWELDNAIQSVAQSLPDHEAMPQLAGVYHNLVREWSDT
jgi:PKHD-type hydroxylase